MKKYNFISAIILLLVILLFETLALADTGSYPINVNGNHVTLTTKAGVNGAELNLVNPGDGPIQIFSNGTNSVDFDAAGIAYPTGKDTKLSRTTAVFVSTPVVGTNQLAPGLNIPGATATANTAVLVGAATPTPGTRYEFYNASASTLRLKAGGGMTMNGATAGGYLIVATRISATCYITDAANLDCRLNVNPTPAGP